MDNQPNEPNQENPSSDTDANGTYTIELETADLSQNESDGQVSKVINKLLPEGMTAVYDVPVQVSAVLGRATMQVNQLLKLGRGAVIELDRKVGEAIDVYVNNRLVARGEVVVVEDHLGITMTEIVKSDRT